MDEFFVGGWLVQPSTCRLHRDGREVRVRAKVMDLLVFLARHPAEVVSKDALLDGVWQTDQISESALTRTMTELRQALGDDAEQPAIIETIAKRGYRLVAPVVPHTAAAQLAPRPQSPQADETHATASRAGRRKVWTAVTVVMVAGAAWLVLLQVTGRLAGNRSGREGTEPRQWVLVTDFDNRTGEQVFDDTIEQALALALADSAILGVVPRQRVQDTLRLMQQPADARIDQRLGRELCARDGAITTLVAGDLRKVGGRYRLTTQLINAADGRVLRSFAADEGESRALVAALGRHAAAIRATLGERHPPSAQRQRPLEQVTTPSLQAFQLYSRAVALTDLWPSGTLHEAPAERLLEDALRQDPEFASAHIMLAWAIRNQDTLPKAPRRDEYLYHVAEAERLSESVTDVERHFIRGSAHFMRAVLAETPEASDAAWHAALAEYEAVVQLQPTHLQALNYLHLVHGMVGRLADDAAVTARIAALLPNNFDANAIAAHSMLRARGIDAAEPYFRRALRLLGAAGRPEPPTLLTGYIEQFEIHDLWRQGRAREASTLLQAAERTARANQEDVWATLRRGFLHLALGQVSRARDTFKQVPDRLARAFGLAAAALAAGETDEVRALVGDYQGYDPAVASLLVRVGDLAGASRVLHHLFGWTLQERAWATAEIDIAAGDTRRTREALAEGPRWARLQPGRVRAFLYSETLARAAAAYGDSGAAIGLLEELRAQRDRTTTPGGHSGYFWIRTQLLLADLYRQAGQLPEARSIERELLGVLATADSDFPPLLELRSRGQ